MSAGEQLHLLSSASILMWRTSSHMNYLFNPAQFLQRVWRLLDELVFLSVKTLSISSAFFLFPDGSLLNPNNLLLFVLLLPSLIPAEEFSHFWLESAVGWKKYVFTQLKAQNFSRTETMSLDLIMKQIQISLKKKRWQFQVFPYLTGIYYVFVNVFLYLLFNIFCKTLLGNYKNVYVICTNSLFGNFLLF